MEATARPRAFARPETEPAVAAYRSELQSGQSRPTADAAARALLVATVLLTVAGCALKQPFTDARLIQAPAAERVQFRLVLIGDAGEPKDPEPVLTVADAWAGRQPNRSHVVFLGDNAYPNGVVASRRADAERRLARQIDAFAPSGVPVTFIPGNHDWDRSNEEGLAAIQAQAAFVTGRGANFLPKAGCPGPEILDLPDASAPVLRVVAIDTQWFLHRHERGAGCSPDSPETVETALRKAAETALPLVVVGHHPIATNGPHGGFHGWRAHLFPLGEFRGWGRRVPLPLIGSLYPVFRGLVPSRQDVGSPANLRMRLAIERALGSATAPAVKIYAAGHEHSLQVLTHSAVDYALVSGAGSSQHESAVTKRYNTLFASPRAGFMVLDVVDGGVRLSVVDPSAGPDQPTPQFALTRRR